MCNYLGQFIHSAFCYVSLVAIFLSKIVRLLFHRVVGMFSCRLFPVVDKIFIRCFGMSCFGCIVLLFVDISSIFLLSPILSGLFPQVVMLFFPCCLFLSFQLISAPFFVVVLSFWLFFFEDFLSVFPVEFLILVLIFSSCFLRGSQLSHKLVSHLHRFFHLTRLYYS